MRLSQFTCAMTGLIRRAVNGYVLASVLRGRANFNSIGQMPNLECFVSRVASHPERLKYVYLNTVVLMRAVARLGPYLSAYDYCSCNSETHEEDRFTLDRLNRVIEIARNVGQFDESSLFRGEDANVSYDLNNAAGPFARSDSRSRF